MQVDSQYTIPTGVQFRYEDFGGVVYRRQDDRLFFLNSRLAVTLLEMAGKGTVLEITAALQNSNLGDKSTIEAVVLKTLSSLEELGIIYELAGRQAEATRTNLPDVANH